MYSSMRIRCLLLLTVSMLGLASQPVRAEESYYMIVFASQEEPRIPRTSHTFATFVKAADERDPKNCPLEVHTISWLPASQVVSPVRLLPEPGHNFSLAETLKWAKEQNLNVTAWGPYRIRKELYDLAVLRQTYLEKGDFSYKAIPVGIRPGVTNCIHAVSDIDENYPLDTGTAYGVPASQMVVDHFRRWMIGPEQTHDWLRARLDLDKNKIQFMTRQMP